MEIFHSSNKCCALLQAIWSQSLFLFWLTDITGPLLTCSSWAIILQRNLSPISSAFPPTQLFQADVSHKNHQKAFLGQISSGTLPPPQQIFNKTLWEDTMPWTTTICSWAPCVPMVCFACWNGMAATAVAFQHAQVSLCHFLFPVWRVCHWKVTWSGTGVMIHSLVPSSFVPRGQHVMVMVTLSYPAEAFWGFVPWCLLSALRPSHNRHCRTAKHFY